MNRESDRVTKSAPDAHLQARRPALEARGRVLSAIRRWFESQGFLEVETPARVRAPGQEVHLDAIASEDRWLVTSPEYAMKRLCGAGFERIVSIGKCWRANERGPHHEPEFTMIEWYRARAPLEQIAEDCEALFRLAMNEAAAGGGKGHALLQGRGPFRRETVRDLVARHAGIDLRGDESAAELVDKARTRGVHLGSAQSWDDVFFQIWLDKVEPALPAAGPLFVFDWPAPLGALARRRVDDPRFVERFELYAAGVELANAFGELTDPVEQRQRFAAESAARGRAGKQTYDVDEKLLAALAHMPATAGVALGFDRLMMLAWGATSIREVIAFASDEV